MSACVKATPSSMAAEVRVQLCAHAVDDAPAACVAASSMRRQPSDIQLRVCRGARQGYGDPASCFGSARKALNLAQATELCGGGGTVERVDCFKRVHRVAPAAAAIQICRQPEPAAAADCMLAAAKERTLSRALSGRSAAVMQASVVALCTGAASTAPVDCYAAAHRTGMSSQAAAQLCAAATSNEPAHCAAYVATHLPLACNSSQLTPQWCLPCRARQARRTSPSTHHE